MRLKTTNARFSGGGGGGAVISAVAAVMGLVLVSGVVSSTTNVLQNAGCDLAPSALEFGDNSQHYRPAPSYRSDKYRRWLGHKEEGDGAPEDYHTPLRHAGGGSQVKTRQEFTGTCHMYCRAEPWCFRSLELVSSAACVLVTCGLHPHAQSSSLQGEEKKGGGRDPRQLSVCHTPLRFINKLLPR